AAHPGRRDRQALPLQHFRDPDLAPGRLLDRQVDHRLLDLRGGAVLQHRLAAADLPEGQLAALFVELPEAVETVAAVAPPLAGFSPSRRRAGAVPAQGENRALPPAPFRKPTTNDL